MFIPLSKLIPRTLRKTGLSHGADAALICQKYNSLAAEIIHPDAMKHTVAKFFRERTLTIGVRNSAWAQVLTDKKDELIKKINRSLATELVKKLRTKVVDLE